MLPCTAPRPAELGRTTHGIGRAPSLSRSTVLEALQGASGRRHDATPLLHERHAHTARYNLSMPCHPQPRPRAWRHELAPYNAARCRSVLLLLLLLAPVPVDHVAVGQLPPEDVQRAAHRDVHAAAPRHAHTLKVLLRGDVVHGQDRFC